LPDTDAQDAPDEGGFRLMGWKPENGGATVLKASELLPLKIRPASHTGRERIIQMSFFKRYIPRSYNVNTQ
jgi:hypothetical protein